MARFFIDRPVLAWVISFILMVTGALSLRSLPIEQYPSVAPPMIQIVATYPGASADTVATSVTQVIEQSLSGIDNVLYISSTSGSTGQAVIQLTLEAGANPDIAQMQVQNKVNQIGANLPLAVEQQGISISKANSNFLMIVAVSSRSGRLNSIELGNLLASRLQDPISEISGVGGVNLFASQHAMRIWLNPIALRSYGLTPTDVTNAIANQNVEMSVGELGGTPAPQGQAINATITASTLLHTADEFNDILLKVSVNGSKVLLKNVARVEIGADTYDVTSRMNGKPSAAIGIQLANGANAIAVAKAVRARVDELRSDLPADVEVRYPFDTTPFVQMAIKDVVQTLFESGALVFVVMLIFLGSVRTTLIPGVVIPVALLGACIVLGITGMSLNVLSMFAVVLAIGLLVDDAIVVVENVNRVMRERRLEPREATRKAMQQITGALVGVTTVLTAVFIPMAFFPGSTGGIYRQFSITIIAAMLVSIAMALTLTPALCATVLKTAAAGAHMHGIFGRFIERSIVRYIAWLTAFASRPVRYLMIFVLIVGGLIWLLLRLPTSYLPDEDQGIAIVLVSTPVGTPVSVTDKTVRQVERYLTRHEPSVDKTLAIDGYSFNGSGQNQAILFVSLKDWSLRSGPGQQAGAILNRINAQFGSLRDAHVIAVNMPAIPGLGSNQSGLDFEIEDRSGRGHAQLLRARNMLMALAAKDPRLAMMSPAGMEDTPQLHVDIDREKASALGLSIPDVNNTLQIAFGSAYVGNYIDSGRLQRVFEQGDAPYRMMPVDINHWFVRANAAQNPTTTGASSIDRLMVPFSAFSTTHWAFGPPQIERYNHMLAMEMSSQAGQGVSTGQAMQAIEQIAKRLPTGFGVEWTGQSYQEALSNSQAFYLYGTSIFIVFLCLAGLYESWSMPFAVILVAPLGMLGAVLAVTLSGMENDIYFKVGLLTTIGLATKNAILIVEFAKQLHAQGCSVTEAALEAARLRVRPIFMTSIAFGCGVLPLIFSSGAGAESRHEIGMAVAGGMLGATLLAVFYVPLFFVVVSKLFRKRERRVYTRVNAGGEQ